jgi:hypothetical protein
MTESITKVGGDLRSLSVGVEGSCKLGEDLLLELVIFGIGSMKIPPLIICKKSEFVKREEMWKGTNKKRS